jgi:amino acid adenylation domain-containing protein
MNETLAVNLSIKEKRALLAQLLQEKAREPKIVPASFAQEQLWFLHQMEPELSAYNISIAVKAIGRMDQAALEQSLNEIVRRHETLRTVFGVSEGQPAQIITPATREETRMPLLVCDLQEIRSEDQTKEVQRLTTREARQPFDLASGPLVRVTLLKLSANEHALLLTMHHIISDGWSTGIFIQELGRLYRAFANGQPSPLPALPIQYADFGTWQRQQLQGERLETLLAYWKKQLEKSSLVLELPGDRVRPPTPSFRGAGLHVQFSATLSQAIRELSRREGVTLFMVLLAAFKALLCRYTGQQDVIVGSPIANRDRAEIEGLIGFFMNMLVLRTDLSGNPTFIELLGRVQQATLGAYAHASLPFEKLVQELQPQRDPSHSPLFQVLFALQNTPEEVIDLQELKLSLLPIRRGTTHYDLSVHILETAEGLGGIFEYSTDLFERETIERMAGHYRTLLESAVAQPKGRLADMRILSEAKRHKILVEWNATQTVYPQGQCIHQLFEARAEQWPDAVAVVFDEQHLTYRQLNQRANQLAHYLQKLGIGPDVPVGVCLEHSPETLVGLLGILKAGGAYAPLDPSYPPDRLAFMLADSQVPVLLTLGWVERQNATPETHVVCLDSDWETITQENTQTPINQATADNLAYIIYTSGSTGRPKGALIPHRGLPNFSEAQIQTFGLTAGDRVLQFAPLSFDASMFEMILASSVGATLCQGTRETLLPGPGLVQWLRDLGVTVVVLTPSALAALPDTELPHLHTIILGGEACSADLVTRWAGRYRFFNGYGPTEATMWTTIAQCVAGDQKPPIGRPIINTQVYLLDQHLQPLPIGVPGELYVNGVGLARGYLNRPGLTAERFIPNPFSTEPDARLYKTGDLARYLPNGDIEFLGRIDHQVKVRGFRIELGEIETVLREHPTIQETVVMAREDQPGNKQLVAYVVPRPGQKITAGDLRQFVKEKLPEHMVPSAFVPLQALPLTPNDKVDRSALPAPNTLNLQTGSDLTAPRTPVEEVLAALWSQLLQVELLGVHQSFFELGGHSLLATQLVTRIRETFQIELPLRALFESPTIAGLAQYIASINRREQDLSLHPLAPITREGKLALSFAQQRLWFLDRLEPGSASYNIPAAVRLSGALDITMLAQSLNEVLQRHEALRTTFAQVDDGAVQVIAPTLTLLLPIVDLGSQSKTSQHVETSRLAIQEAQRPFDLARGPLVRATLLRLGREEHVLLLTMHHIISDGWSMGVFIQEVAAFYTAFINGEIPSLPELPIQYADYALWQRQWLQGEVLDAQLAYWKAQLGDTSGVLELPTHRPRPPLQTFNGAIQPLALSKASSVALKALSQQEGTTLFMTLLAGFKALLYRYTGQRDILVGSPIANRNRAEVEGLIGFFTNTLVLRTRLSDAQTFRELLSQVRETALGAYVHQDLPFEMLVEELKLQRDLSRTPLFQIMFVLQNAPLEIIDLPGLTLHPLETSGGTAKFDLTLSMVETERGLRGEIEYNTDLFDATAIAQLASHFCILLESVVATKEGPDQSLADLPLLSEPERHRLLVTWNATQMDYPQDACVQTSFEAQASRKSDAIAVIFQEQHITYRELDRRANQLAHYLQKLGVGPEVLVGICVERSLEMVLGLLGILKAGGAYVPLDPTYPQARLAFILKDTQSPVLLTHSQLLGAHQPQTQVVCLDTDWETIAAMPPTAPTCLATSGHLAYVIHTSGSTGKPKGVLILHRAVVNFLQAMRQQLDLTEGDRLLSVTTLSFDIAVLELFFPLTVGASVELVSRALAGDGLGLAKRLAASGPIVMQATPATWRLLLEAGWQGERQLQILCGGEAFPRTLANQLLSRGRILWNLYGPTETTVWSAAYEVTPGEGLVPIGRPIDNTQIYLLDACLKPVPVGVPGALYIGGAGLARGYLGRPALTAEKFIPHPFSAQPGARLYKTGDLARYLPDGNIEFLNRMDHQVKVRGFRIELGEIETVLGQYPALRETVVLAREDEPGDKRLVAYMVTHDGQAPTVSELRRFLQQRLPDYMLPSAFMNLEALPLTPNGKIDRRALPAPELIRPRLEQAFVAPRTPAEETLAAIWTQTLGVEQIGIHDDFFDVGGHSLLSIQVMSRVSDAFQVELPLRIMFETPTIAGLAESIKTIQWAAEGLHTVDAPQGDYEEGEL